MTWLPVDLGDSPSTMAALWGEMSPTALVRFRDLHDQLSSASNVDRTTIELVRLRIAQVLGAELVPPPGLDDVLVLELPRWLTSAHFSEARRAALRFGEQYVIDPHGVENEEFRRLHAHWSDEAIATIVLAVAMADALTRMGLALGVEPAT